MGNFTMSRKEMEQIKIFEKLLEKTITQKDAARFLNLTDRQVRNKLKRYKKFGESSLIHLNRGKPSPRKWNEKQRALCMKLLENEWKNFGPKFTVEKLYEFYGIKISKETVRKEMIKNGFWNAKIMKPKHRKCRPRKSCFGIMVQLDGSPHDWFEGRGPKCTLLVFIDDGTGYVYMEFAKSESVEAVMKATENYLKKFGRPCEFYVDHGSVFSVNLNNAECTKITQWKRALRELDIKVIYAGSPQAKGRVERSNQTHQDRLTKELRLAGASTIEAANIFLQTTYNDKHNKMFAVKPEQTTDMHRSIEGFDLKKIFCIKDSRILANDYTICYKKRIFQLEKQQRTIVRPKEDILVSESFDGVINLSIRNVPLFFKELSIRPQKMNSEKIYNFVQRKVHPNSKLWNSGYSASNKEFNVVK